MLHSWYEFFQLLGFDVPHQPQCATFINIRLVVEYIRIFLDILGNLRLLHLGVVGVEPHRLILDVMHQRALLPPRLRFCNLLSHNLEEGFNFRVGSILFSSLFLLQLYQLQERHITTEMNLVPVHHK